MTITNQALHEERLARARVSLEGLSVGDGFGMHFELGRTGALPYHVQTRQPAAPPWHFTDDTNMALSIYAILRYYGEIRQDKLAAHFAEHFESTRGYGLGARHLMVAVRKGRNWREVSLEMFGGEGSFGNGAGMRVAPLGAYFADDLPLCVEQARLSSEITHAHPEGIAGGVAVAAAAALAWQMRGSTPSRRDFIDAVLPYIPESDVKRGAVKARDLGSGVSVETAVAALGNGSRVTAQDSVPFVLYCAGEHLNDYVEAIWLTASGGGDVDTTCAMVGGIVATHTGIEQIPPDWIAAREALPAWAFEG